MDSNITRSFRCNLEGRKPGVLPFLHNGIHSWVGGGWSSVFFDRNYDEQKIVFVGTLTALDTSPNDPVFFLHHCNVDRIWALKEDRDGPSYEPTSGAFEGWNLDDEMYPYTLYKDSELVTRQGITNARRCLTSRSWLQLRAALGASDARLDRRSASSRSGSGWITLAADAPSPVT